MDVKIVSLDVVEVLCFYKVLLLDCGVLLKHYHCPFNCSRCLFRCLHNCCSITAKKPQKPKQKETKNIQNRRNGKRAKKNRKLRSREIKSHNPQKKLYIIHKSHTSQEARLENKKHTNTTKRYPSSRNTSKSAIHWTISRSSSQLYGAQQTLRPQPQ